MESLDQDITLYLNSMYSDGFDTFFWYVSLKYTWFIMGALLITFLFVKRKPKEALWFLLAVVLMIVCADQLCNLCKYTVQRFRPCWDEEIKDLVHIVNDDRGGKYGFFSAHAAVFFGLAYMTSRFFRNKYFTATIYVIAVMVAYSRIYLGRHYLGDVLVGAVVGTLFAMLAWWGYKYWMRRDLMRKEERGKI
ncbi:MAG: phosphatase PAP2 family protein [Bacteroidales bacterium]|jgi:undecaprenyl-diphosphatase|nr:phosphatase PAP2 family protein [Bacteroidales bacterium]